MISGEGDLGAGPGAGHPNADPDSPGFKFMFENVKGQNQRSYIIESDSGPGGTTPTRAARCATRRRAPRRCSRGARARRRNRNDEGGASHGAPLSVPR